MTTNKTNTTLWDEIDAWTKNQPDATTSKTDDPFQEIDWGEDVGNERVWVNTSSTTT